jgi:hypothetical protein
MPKPKARDRTWIKNHTLEGDGLVTGFYNFLYKRNTKTMKPCKDVFIPDTIVFDHNFPRGWYTSDLKAKEISKKQGKELDAASIAAGFSKQPSPGILIVASYMCSFEVENEHGETEVCTQVEFFNEATLKEFVARKTKREGILQRFNPPKGHRNSVIQAVWSPRVCIVQRRTNVGSMLDKVQAEKDPYPIAVTYEGPSHYSEEGSCAGHTTIEIKNICSNIVSHFYSTEHKYITRMVLYFKVDEKDQVWLLWCGSLRVSDRDAPSQMPLNLAPQFSSPSLEVFSPEGEERALKDADFKHCEMTNDALFYETYVRERSPSPQSQSGSPTKDKLGKVDGDKTERSVNARKDPAAKQQATRLSADDQADQTWHRYPGIQDQYRELCTDRDYVLSAFEDIFYEAYGHFLRHEPGPFVFEVSRKVAQTLSEELLADLMQFLKIEHVAEGDGHNTEELSFSIPFDHHTPVTRLGDEAGRWIQRHYQTKEHELRDEAAAIPKGQEQQAAAPAADDAAGDEL